MPEIIFCDQWCRKISSVISDAGKYLLWSVMPENIFCDQWCQKISFVISDARKYFTTLNPDLQREKERKKKRELGAGIDHFPWPFWEMLLYFLSAVSLCCSLSLCVSVRLCLSLCPSLFLSLSLSVCLSLSLSLYPCDSEYKLTCCFHFSWSNLPFRNQFCCSCLPLNCYMCSVCARACMTYVMHIQIHCGVYVCFCVIPYVNCFW